MSVDEAMSLSDDELLARIEQVVGMSIEEVHELYGVKEEEQSE